MIHETPTRCWRSRLTPHFFLLACLLAVACPLSAAPIQPDPQDPSLFFYEGETTLLAGYYPGLQALSVSPQVNPTNPLGSNYYVDLINTLTDSANGNHANLIRVMLTPNMALEDPVWLHPYQRAKSPSCSLNNSNTCTIHSSVVGVAGNKFDLDRWNESFFQYWDAVIGYAESRDVIVQVNFWSGTHHRKLQNDNGSVGIPFRHGGRIYEYYEGGNNVNGVDLDETSTLSFYQNADAIEREKDFIDKAVQTLGDHDNVIWEIINEGQAMPVPLPGQKGGHPWYQEMRSQIRASEALYGHPAHMIMPYDSPDHRYVAGHFTPGDNNSDSDYKNVHTNLVAQYDQYPTPIIADNDCCFTPGTPDQLRKKAWTSLVSGAHPEMLVWPVTGTGSPWGLGVDANGVPNPNHQTQKGIRYTGFVRKFVQEQGIDLRGMVPRDDLLGSPSPAGFVWNRAKEGSRYIVYFFKGGSATVLGLPSSFDAWWFNPRSGAFTTASPVSGTHFQAPSSSDWVLYVEGHNEIVTTVAADAFVAEDNATFNYGSHQQLQIRTVPPDNGTFSFLKFDVPYISGAVISAKLRLRTQETTVEGLGVYEMNNMNWSEGTVTFNNWDQNGAVTFGFLGGDSYLEPNMWHDLDVTAAVSGEGIVTFGLASSDDLAAMDFWSRESSYRPKLVIQKTTFPGNLVIEPIADAWVWAGQANNNFGSRSELRVRNDPQTQGRHSFLGFDVPNYPGNLVSATLRIRTGPNPIPNATIYRMINMQWNESTINWNNWDDLGTVGFEFVTGTGQATLAANTWYEFDVTSTIQGPATTLNLGLTTPYDLNGLSFKSRESGYSPELIIRYEP